MNDRFNPFWKHIFPIWTLFVGLTLVLSGCLKSGKGPTVDNESGETSEPLIEGKVTTAPAEIDPIILERRDFGEAPMLTEKVKAGLLPSIAERLPENPLVIVPISEIGRYGGTIRRALTEEIVETRGVTKTLNENLMGYKRPLAEGIELNLAEGYAFQNDNKVAVFHLRKGIKWSDGHPFTVDDILFWYYDVSFNPPAREDRNSLPPTGWMIEGEPMKMEKLDDFTLRIEGKYPLGRLLHELCQDKIAFPKHYWSRFHPKYNPEATYEAFREQTKESNRTFLPGIPTLSAWVAVEWIRGQRIVYERNPYYWKIDSAGNQLPYADGLAFSVIQDPQVILLRFMNGQLDLFGRYFRDHLTPILYAEAGRASFQLHTSTPQYGPGFYPNWNPPKESLREAFRNRNVRIALSLAINREEINQVLYHGYLIPAGFSFSPGSPYFSREASMRYAEYDPVRADSLLTGEGYVDRDGDGYREFKDGSRFEFTVDTRMSQADLCELVIEQWNEIGLKVYLFPALRDILGERRATSQFDISYWDIEGAEDPLAREALWGIMGPLGAPLWHMNAYEDGPVWLWEATRALIAARSTVDPEKLRNLMIQVRDLHTENIPTIAVGFRQTLWGSHNRLRNVPHNISASGVYRGWSRPIMHEQLYIDESVER